eukprot:TRINITY_DN1274_c0_g2_i2.p1 TRINITY_DN1274_c0_g2~~TRINITY_DN1274_c0_g2_i2.p1  ORF type:complete len:215 (-),score=69.23 TRINITY_DN1274_c0_g2_i2:32-676(-)
MRSKTLRRSGQFLSPEAFRRRKQSYINVALQPPPVVEEKKQGGEDEMPQINPEEMAGSMDMMKQSMLGIVPQMLSIGWVSYFFSGFVLLKLPFPLTDTFKQMLQRGINLQSLDASYVSSLSWYFITLFGLRGLFSIVLGGDNAADDTKLLQQQAAMGGMMGGGPAMPGLGGMKPDLSKPFKEEKDELAIYEHKYVVPRAQYRLLGIPLPRELAD